jgi:hypothetical protein
MYGFVFIFSQICYYLSLRLDECNKQLELYAKHSSKYFDLMKIIGEHNKICKE